MNVQTNAIAIPGSAAIDAQRAPLRSVGASIDGPRTRSRRRRLAPHPLSLPLRMLRRFLFSIVGFWNWILFGLFNRFRAEGREHLEGLPESGVLFVSNHLTYYMDVPAIHHALRGARCTPLGGLLARKIGMSFVAARETLTTRGFLPKLFTFTGAVLIRRTWREGGREVQRAVDPADLQKMGDALARDWLITFPQGTTKPEAPVRKGVGHLIRQHRPIVVPVRLEGFDEAFVKSGFRSLRRGVDLSVRFGAPLRFAADASVDEIVEKVAEAIGVESPSR